MSVYVIRRLLLTPFLLFGVTVLIFLMLQFISPVERSALYVREMPKNARAVEGVIKQYGFDRPWYEQYWRWLAGYRDPASGEFQPGILQGNFGWSRVGSEPVLDMIRQRLPATLELALWSVAPMIWVGVWLGVQAAVRHNTWFDQAARVFSIVGSSFPTFVFGLIVLMVFYANLHWFPPGRVSDWASQAMASGDFHHFTYLITLDSLFNGRLDIFFDALRHLVLPVLTLAYINWAGFLRVTRSAMLDTLRQEYVMTARSKGIKERDVINQHARPNALIPITTLAGFEIIGLLGGVVITETVFNSPGIGLAAAEAAAQLDVITVLGFALFNGLILIIANLVVDIIYGLVDPRVRLA